MRRDGPFVARDGARECFLWHDGARERRMAIPEAFRAASPLYRQGLLHRVELAIRLGMKGDGEAVAYVQHLARRQVAAGARYLDVTVDAMELDGEKWTAENRGAALRWLVETVQAAAGEVPLALNSMRIELVEAALSGYDFARSCPLVNYSSGMDPHFAELAAARKLPLVWFATNTEGMPHSAAERLANIEAGIAACERIGIPPRDRYFDVCVYPKMAGAAEAHDALLAFEQARARFGPEVQLIAGVENHSYRLPMQRLFSLVFLECAIERGASGAVLDPLRAGPRHLKLLDRSSVEYRRAREVVESPGEAVLARFIEDAKSGALVDPFTKK